MITIALYLGLMLTALPIGIFLAWLCKDELRAGRKWFFVILYSLVISILVFLLVWSNVPILLSLSYMVIVTFVSLFKSVNQN